MPQGEGTYGSQRGRPKKVSNRKKAMKEAYGGIFAALISEARAALIEKKDKKWMQKADKAIERRGTEGKCTPMTKPGCTGRALALAKTFHKIAAKRKGN